MLALLNPHTNETIMKNYILLGMALLFANLSLAQSRRNSAEVFIQIEDRGNFTVYLDNEFIGSASGKFRFFDVIKNSGNLTIVANNQKIFNRQIDLRPNERLILNFSRRTGLRTINSLQIYRNGQYALNDFDGYSGSYNTGIVPPRPVDNNPDLFNFASLNELVKRTAFDEEKIKVIQLHSSAVTLTVEQTGLLLKHFLKDEVRLNAIRSLSRSIIDPQNLYQLKDAFTFTSGKEEFLKYLNGNNAPAKLMSARDYELLLSSVRKESFDDQKTKVILAAIQYNSPSTAQVGELLKLYSFDDSALAAAKLFYNSVSDPQRYFTLKDVFRYISNRDAFIEFLGRH